MSLTAKIASSEDTFKLSQKIVSALADKFSFKFEDGWNTISSRPVDTIQKRIRREKRRANPTSSIKHARTAFSFFTQKQRPLSQAAHPEASFGQLSRYVSEAWKALTPAQMAEYKTLENADKERYQKERSEVLSNMPAVVGDATPVEEVAEPVKEKKVRKAKSAEAKVPETPATPAVETPAKKVKTPKADAKAEAKTEAKAKTPKAKAVKTEAPKEEAPKETAKPAKKAKTPKA
jgi:hypothetical protein